uniref:Uncharacterized protein n=1 Tax=Siphoviridae sp. ctcK97 TaxID=2825571 RepID=A0A8S5UB07_9CAUD|nr:MAG TPA: hypothetical protein [Siphoviridae sp. ctcK97]
MERMRESILNPLKWVGPPRTKVLYATLLIPFTALSKGAKHECAREQVSE